jgi:hypothetical protein
MTPMARKALEYVRNAGGNATTESFFEDHAPVGPNLWQELRFPNALIEHDKAPGRDRYLVLTDAGRAALAAS